MTNEAFVESRITFGPYEKDTCFRIEKSNFLKETSKKFSFKIADFTLIQKNNDGSTVWIVEAKESCPRKTETFMDEIREQLHNSMMFGIAACFAEHPLQKEIPLCFKELDIKLTKFMFALIIKGVPDSHLEGLQNVLASALQRERIIWGLKPTSIKVLNEEKAKEKGLITP